ncbi:hypothetical protein L211DRAFT_335939 [Terfezia boudieri ATCC MYA-4762]|uniref:Glc8 protein n=1 Tax=Terfezia boudieri ATCC MYA-4762 TaxID=1051890 RepID=A0A3N4LHM7_9PEZI|nr:hypothetical protein L211DRAFT_335939 [Terfezia boudieri ATCC MYA-4762]
MSLVYHSPPSLHSPNHKRPKSILKNSTSYHRSPPLRASVTEPVVEAPTMERQLSEKDIVLENTLRNAGRRRSTSGSRRQSSTAEDSPDQASSRLKWDEANLYLTEQQKSSTMKITEPKTPYAKRYDPAEDEAEFRTLDAQDLIVDELDGPIKGSAPSPPWVGKGKHHATREEDIPGLELGEPEESIPKHNHASPKQVIVVDEEGIAGHYSNGENDGSETPEEEEKHRKFAELRKKHYEMKDVKELLGHPEDLEEEDDDGDVELKDAPNGVSPVPSMSTNGGSSQ